MKKILGFFVFFALVPLFVSGYSGLTYYGTKIGPNDFYSSKGAKLGSLPAILQQDRANYHKFKKRDAQDQYDDFFTNLKNRQKFSNAHIKIEPSLKRDILNGKLVLVTVYVFDEGSMEVKRGLPPINYP